MLHFCRTVYVSELLFTLWCETWEHANSNKLSLAWSRKIDDWGRWQISGHEQTSSTSSSETTLHRPRN